MNRLYLSIHMTEGKLILCEGIVSKRVYPDINYVYLARMNYDDILELVKAVPEFTIVQPWPPHNKIGIDKQRNWVNSKYILILVPKTSDSNITIHMKYQIEHARGLPALRVKDFK